MATLRILSSEGDYATNFEAEAHEEAARLFERMRANYTAFKIMGVDQPAIRLDAFDPTADEIIMVPKIVGG